MAQSNMSAAVLEPTPEAVCPATALRVRRAIYSHDRLLPSDMDLVFDVARQAGNNSCPEWTSVFCDALTDYVVHQNVPRDYIPDDKAGWLIDKLTKNGGISTKTEFAMLIDVMTHALSVSVPLSAFALNEIKTAILCGRRAAFTDESHPAGVVTKTDVEALRAVLYAATVGTPCHVSQEEAEVLFQIAHASRGKVDPSFDDLFARAIGNYLMGISVHASDAAEALHFEKWLDERESLSNFFSRMFQPVPAGNTFNVLQSPEDAYEDDLAKQLAEDKVLREESEKVTQPEAEWVVAHLTRDGELTSAEKRLLQFLGTEVSSMPPSLRTLIGKVTAPPARRA